MIKITGILGIATYCVFAFICAIFWFFGFNMLADIFHLPIIPFWKAFLIGLIPYINGCGFIVWAIALVLTVIIM